MNQNVQLECTELLFSQRIIIVLSCTADIYESLTYSTCNKMYSSIIERTVFGKCTVCALKCTFTVLKFKVYS